VPVDVGSGTQFTAWEDIEVDGLFPLVWRRFYSTGLVKTIAPVIGTGWMHSFDMTLRCNPDRYTFRGPDGMDVVFEDAENVLAAGGTLLEPLFSLEMKRDPRGIVLYHWHDWESEVHKFVFYRHAGELLRLDRIELPSGHGLTLSYDSTGRLIEIRQDIEQRRLLLTYEPRGWISKLFFEAPNAPRELVCEYEYGDSGDLVAVTDASGAPLIYAYDGYHRLVMEKMRTGGAYYMKYDERGRCVETTGERRYGMRRISYNDGARITTVTDSLGGKSIYQLNARGQVETEGLPNGQIRSKEFDTYGRVTLETSGPAKTAYEYDPAGNLQTTTAPNGGALTVEFDEAHLPLLVTEADGAQWQFEYSRGALVCITDPLGNASRYVRDQQNLIVEIRTPLGNRIAVEQDVNWTQQRFTDALGLISLALFDARLNIVALYDSRGLAASFRYDQSGRLTAVIDPSGAQRLFRRDPAGRLVGLVDPEGNITELQYSNYSDLIAVTNANRATYRFSTDTEGRVIEVVNPNEERTVVRYDAVGGNLSVRHFDGKLESFVFDAQRRCVQKRKADSTVLSYKYNLAGLITSVKADSTCLIENTYDICDQLLTTVTPGVETTFEYNLCGRVVREIQGDRTVDYKMGAGGFVVAFNHDTSRVGGLRFGYDLRGRTVSLATSEQIVQTYEYDSADLLLSRQLATLEETYTYDDCRRVSKRALTKYHSQEIAGCSYEYDMSGNLIRESDSRRGVVNYTYGPSGLLLRSDHSNRGAVEYRYDICGNMVSKGSVHLRYGDGNRLLSAGEVTYSTDPNGNRIESSGAMGTTRYVWDPLDQLSRVVHPDGTETTYRYDGIGRRTWKCHAGVETEFVWAGDNLLAEQTGKTYSEYAIARFLPDAIWRNGEIQHVVRSWRDMPADIFDGEGDLLWSAEYDDWGRLIGDAAGPTAAQLRLMGQYFDSESGLHYNRFRYYDPAVGRFISPDPLGVVAGLNEYLYAPNPINWSDPLGLYCGKKSCRNSVYVLKKNGKIVYVGITKRAVSVRGEEHADKGKDFDEIVPVATGLTRLQARNIEGSALMNIHEGDVPGVTTPDLQNKKTLDGSPYHAYDENTSGPGRQTFSGGQSAAQLNSNVTDSQGNPVSYTNP
jgi:RHS repeat-associated protein